MCGRVRLSSDVSEIKLVFSIPPHRPTLTASIAALPFGRQVWRDVNLVLQLADGRLQVSPLRLALPGGLMEMQSSANASAQDVPVSLTLHAPGIPLALLARYAALPGDAGGDLRVGMQLKG